MLLHLTEVHAPGGRGPRPVRINPEAIAMYREPGGTAGSPDGAGTYMSLIGDRGLYLAETPEQIDEAWERIYPTFDIEDRVEVAVGLIEDITLPLDTVRAGDDGSLVATGTLSEEWLAAHPVVAERLRTASADDPQLVEVNLDDMDLDATEAERGVRLVIERRDQGADLNAWTEVYTLWDREVPVGTFPDYRITPGP